ncbi:MAG: glycosyltransferase [Elusimicrobia bacterium]|nr:glycosyltransferase [Candidatus Liberimonas magnetica]
MNYQTLKVSVITVTYNNAGGLEKTIHSLIEQKYPNIEYIIVDGGSQDNTVEIIKKYEKHISKWVSEKDKGIYDAMNKGILMSTGDIFNFMNSGDLFYSDNVLNDVARLFNENTGIVYGRSEQFSEVESIKYLAGKEIDSSRIWKGMFVCHQSVFYNRKLFELFGLHDLRFRIAADYEFLLRIINGKGHNFKLIYTDLILSKAELYGTSSNSYAYTWSEFKKAAGMYYKLSFKNNFYFTLMYVKSYLLILLNKIGLLKHYRKIKYYNLNTK